VSDLDYILECIVSELELERELGARVVEIDRSLLEVSDVVRPSGDFAPGVNLQTPEKEVVSHSVAAPEVPPPKSAAPVPTVNASPQAAATGAMLAFLADGVPSKNAASMLGKIVAALEGNSSSMPVVYEGELPDAKAYIVLGARALMKWFPSHTGIPGEKFTSPSGRTVLVTYSPEKILRYNVVTETVQNMKKAMWANIKSVYAEVRRAK
jgi:hypothetical protein